MASLQSNAPVTPSEGRGYDPEIKDIADYIHNKPIDSDLAVSLPPCLPNKHFTRSADRPKVMSIYPAHFLWLPPEYRG